MEGTEEVKRNEFDCIRSPCESCEVDCLDMMLSREVENGIRNLGKKHHCVSSAVRA